MNAYHRWTWLALAAAGSLALARPVMAASEDALIKDLDSANPSVVAAALQSLEKQYPTSTKAIPVIKKLLTDKRDKVRRKAARVLGALHAEVSSEDIKAIAALIKSSDVPEATDGLKALRGLKAAEAIPDILPVLKNANAHLVRDACRTLAALGNKDVIPSIEPLLNHPEAAVKKDAQDAIHTLRAK